MDLVYQYLSYFVGCIYTNNKFHTFFKKKYFNLGIFKYRVKLLYNLQFFPHFMRYIVRNVLGFLLYAGLYTKSKESPKKKFLKRVSSFHYICFLRTTTSIYATVAWQQGREKLKLTF